MIIKLLFARDSEDPTRFSKDPTGYSIMIKDAKSSWDGWCYSDGGPFKSPVRENAATFFDPNAGFGLSCMSCHASTDNPESTYASLRNLKSLTPIEHPTSISQIGVKEKIALSAGIHTEQVLKAERATPPGSQRPIGTASRCSWRSPNRYHFSPSIMSRKARALQDSGASSPQVTATRVTMRPN